MFLGEVTYFFEEMLKIETFVEVLVLCCSSAFWAASRIANGKAGV
jgi:hypothetical protein